MEKPRLPEQVREFARSLRLQQTDAEKLLWRLLRDKRIGFKFRREHPVAGYVLDFYCHQARLCVEIDGGQHNSDGCRDGLRTIELRRRGIEVVRFWNHEVLRDTDAVLERIFEEVSSRAHRG